MKPHIIVSETPLASGHDYKAICGEVIRKAEFVFIWDTEGAKLEVTFNNTCEGCILAAAPEVGQPQSVRFVFGAVDGQAFHDAEVKRAQRKLERAREKAKRAEMPQVAE